MNNEVFMQTRIAVPISASNKADLLSQAKKAVGAGAEILELRIDYLRDLSVELTKDIINSIQQFVSIPLIVTCRDKKEGGANAYPKELRLNVLIQAVRESIAFVDMEFTNFKNKTMSVPLVQALSKADGTRLILSAHNFNEPFKDLAKLCKEIRLFCPDAIPKLAYKAKHINDCFDAFDLFCAGYLESRPSAHKEA